RRHRACHQPTGVSGSMKEFLGEGCRACALIRDRRGDVKPHGRMSTVVSRPRVCAEAPRPSTTARPVAARLKENIMSDDNKVLADLRTSFGKGFARRLRAEGKIPAVIYGHGE